MTDLREVLRDVNLTEPAIESNPILGFTMYMEHTRKWMGVNNVR